MNLRLRVLPLLSAGLALGAAGGAIAQTSISKESPFMPVAGAGPAAATPGETIEFAGVMSGDQQVLVNIYDKQAKKGRWIKVGDTVDGFNVLRFDARREEVVVKIGSDQKTLPLRKTTGNSSGPAPIAFVPPSGFNTPAPTPPAVEPPAAAAPAPVATTPPATNPPPAAAAPPAKSGPPPTPASIARQEEEARMLVSDLLEIGMAQRKAYEEKQKASAAAAAQGTQSPPPVQPNSGG